MGFGMKIGLKIFLGILISLLVIAAVFCLVTLIFSTIKNVSFVDQIKTWFGIAKDTVDTIPKDNTAAKIMLNIFR